MGGIVPGIITGMIAYYASYPLILAYQRGRIHRLKERFEKRRRVIEAARAARPHLDTRAEGADAADKGAKLPRARQKPREAG